MQARPRAAWEKAGCGGVLGGRQVSVASLGAVMLLSSLKPEAGARDATHSHQDENKQEKLSAGLELAGEELPGSVWGQSGTEAGEAWTGRWDGEGSLVDCLFLEGGEWY